jgi:hypothetical protein
MDEFGNKPSPHNKMENPLPLFYEKKLSNVEKESEFGKHHSGGFG